ncbi:hypothetical protein NHQ30_008817 [Ciborinia camelliae]|nr:hypothetical protein NHQ30_008817 [Ciborinia camelliae]
MTKQIQKKPSQIENLKTFVDPFAEADEVDLKHTNQIHLRAQATRGPAKRGGDGKSKPHMLTTIEGLPARFDKTKIVKFLKKKLACGGKVVQDEERGQVIQIQGDYVEKIEEWLTAKDGLELNQKLIVVHGGKLIDHEQSEQ